MNKQALYLASLAVGAMKGFNAVGVRPPLVETDDYLTGGVLDDHGRRWVVTAPKTDLAAAQLEAQAALAPELLHELASGRLSFDVMRPSGFTVTPNGGRAVLYPEPFGRSLDFDTMNPSQARDLGRTLGSIHGLDPDVIRRAGLPIYSAAEWRSRLGAQLEEASQAIDIPPLLRRRWENALALDELWNFTPRVVHGDVSAENFLYVDDTVSCVLGFGSAHVGDPAEDLGVITALDDDVATDIIEAYAHTGPQADESLMTRSYLMSELALVRWLLYGVHSGNDSVLSDAVGMLDDLAAQVSSDPDLAPRAVWNTDIVEEPEDPSLASIDSSFDDDDSPATAASAETEGDAEAESEAEAKTESEPRAETLDSSDR
ncbi:MAG: phosphotransferase [Actinomycetaceae bacterium]|nr:phosphotransferase [Actinomycetaceae bacterium]MDY6082393.1 phosphotransferase [Actinomycetaceae bacterium]